MQTICNGFLQHCTRKGCKPATLRQYRSRVKSLSERFPTQSWSELTRLDLLNWIHDNTHWPDGKEKAKATVRSYLIVIQLLQDYAVEFHSVKRLLKKKDLKKPSGAKRETLPTADDVARIMDAAPADFRLIYRALRLTGARPSELTNARIEQIEQGRTLVLTEHKTARKTGKPRRIPLGSNVAPVFAEAIGERTSGPIFLDRSGRAWNVPRLSRIFRNLRRKLALPDGLVLYCTRHEFGSAVAKKFGILQAGQLLGHSDITTTQRYTHLSEDELRQYQEGAMTDIADSPQPSCDESTAA